jgi:hypothetical protein
VSTVFPSTTPFNPLAKWEDPNGIRKFSNGKLQSAIDDALKALPADAHAAIVAHHVYEQSGMEVDNRTTVSIFLKGPAGFTLAAAGFKDWVKGDIGAEAKLVKVF